MHAGQLICNLLFIQSSAMGLLPVHLNLAVLGQTSYSDKQFTPYTQTVKSFVTFSVILGL